MERIEKTGKTVDEAVQEALSELNASRDEVDVKVLEEGSRGFFGIGGRPFLVEVMKIEKKNPRAEKAENFLKQVLAAMKIPSYTVEAKQEGMQLYLNVYGKDMGILIGKRGQTLNALQYLVSLATNHGPGEYLRIILDVEGYRERREETLIQLANNIAQRVVTQGRRKVLEPMNPQERRIIHTALQDNKDVYTYSEGRDPYRRVIIALREAEDRL